MKHSRPPSPRGFTLVELIVSQVIVGIIAAGVFSLIAAQTRSFHSTWSATEAQTRLREATHLILRDVQGLGDVDEGAGSAVGFIDGGNAASDTMMSFRNDITLCGGGQGATLNVGTDTIVLANVDHDGDGGAVTPDVCPIDNLPDCATAEIVGRTLMLTGPGPHGYLLASGANAGACTISFASGTNTNHLANFAAIHQLSLPATTADALATMDGGGGGDIAGATFGTSMRFFVDPANNTLQRSVNGQGARAVVDGVYDFQVATAHDLDGDGAIGGGEWKQSSSLSGASANNFFAMRMGLMAFANSKKNIEKPPPTRFGNRSHIGAPTGRRYRQSYVVAAARNR